MTACSLEVLEYQMHHVKQIGINSAIGCFILQNDGTIYYVIKLDQIPSQCHLETIEGKKSSA